jgi:hypothetical protein
LQAQVFADASHVDPNERALLVLMLSDDRCLPLLTAVAAIAAAAAYQLYQLWEYRRAVACPCVRMKRFGVSGKHTSNRVPAVNSRPGRIWHNWCWQARVDVHACAACRASINNIRQTLVSFAVDPRVKESELWSAFGQKNTVQVCHDRRKGRR